MTKTGEGGALLPLSNVGDLAVLLMVTLRERERENGCIAQRLIADTTTLAVSCDIASQHSFVGREDIKAS